LPIFKRSNIRQKTHSFEVALGVQTAAGEVADGVVGGVPIDFLERGRGEDTPPSAGGV
jgi:hypothetical protein